MLKLIAKSPTLRVLLASRVVSELGTWLAYVALAVAVYDETHSAVWVSVLLLLGLLPATVVGLTLAPLIDRVDRKPVLVGSELVAGAAFVVLTFVHGLVPLLVFSAVAGAAGAMFRPAQGAVVRQLVADDDLPAANSLLMSVQSAAIIFGPSLAGVLVGVSGVGVVFALNALSFVGSALFLLRLPSLPSKPQPDGRTPEPYRSRVKAGFAIFAPPLLRGVLISWTITALALSLINVCEILVAKQVFQAGDGGYGVLAAGSGVGLLAGSLVSSRLYSRFSPIVVYSLALTFAGTLVMVAAVSPSFALVVPLFAAGAGANSVSVVGLQLLVQRNAGDAIGQAFGIISSSSVAMGAVGLLSAGVAAELWGARAVWIVGGAVIVAAALAVTVLARSEQPVAVPA